MWIMSLKFEYIYFYLGVAFGRAAPGSASLRLFAATGCSSKHIITNPRHLRSMAVYFKAKELNPPHP